MRSLFILISLLALFSCKHSVDWNETKHNGTLEAYRKFLKENPKSKYADTAKQKINFIEDSLWNISKINNTKQAYQKYLDMFSKGKYINIANKMLDSINLSNNIEKEWENCIKKNDTISFKEFIKKYPDNYHLTDAERKIFLIKNPKFNDDYKKILIFFDKIGKQDFNDISRFFAYKTIFEKNSVNKDKVMFDENGDTLSAEAIDSIRLAKSEPKTPPYTKQQLFEYGFDNISNLLIYRTFLNGIITINDCKNIRNFSLDKNYFTVNIIYCNKLSKGNLSVTWIKENDEWCISKFINNIEKI